MRHAARRASSREQQESVERTLQFAEKVTRELLPLTPKETLMLDVTTAQLKVMFVIFLRGPVRMSMLADALGVRLPTMTVTVDRLVKRGILLRQNDPEDGRVVFCHLTKKGQAILDQLWNSARERTRQMLSVLSVDELKVVEQALEILLKAGQITKAGESGADGGAAQPYAARRPGRVQETREFRDQVPHSGRSVLDSRSRGDVHLRPVPK